MMMAGFNQMAPTALRASSFFVVVGASRRRPLTVRVHFSSFIKYKKSLSFPSYFQVSKCEKYLIFPAMYN